MNHTQSYVRPVWTCGRYNAEKHVAIMYNLIAGYSFFFEKQSADVIGCILSIPRNGEISLSTIAQATQIAEESILDFFGVLEQQGLITASVPTEEGIRHYRDMVYRAKEQQVAFADKPVKEKLPVATTNAEQMYYDAVDDGHTVCSVLMELTYRCSEMCIHCYNPGATRNNTEQSHRADYGEMTMNDYRSVIDEMYDLGLVKVCLSGGDPFSKEFAWDLIDYLYQKGIAFDIFTNGQRIVNDIQRLADYYPRLVGVSIYSGVAKDHDAITRISGSWQRSMQVVEQLSRLAVPMNLKCCVMQPNLHSYYMVADLAKKYHAQPQFELNITESNDGDVCAKHLRLTEEQLQVVLRDNNVALYVGKEAPNYGGSKRNPDYCTCGAGRNSFCLSPNGDLRACPAFTQVYGNVNQSHIIDILENSSTLQEWRTAVLADYTECGKYDYCNYCNLCAGINYTEHGDFRKPAESNCHLAKARYNLAHQLMAHDAPMDREQFVRALQALPKNKVSLQREYHTKG